MCYNPPTSAKTMCCKGVDNTCSPSRLVKGPCHRRHQCCHGQVALPANAACQDSRAFAVSILHAISPAVPWTGANRDDSTSALITPAAFKAGCSLPCKPAIVAFSLPANSSTAAPRTAREARVQTRTCSVSNVFFFTGRLLPKPLATTVSHLCPARFCCCR